MTSDAPSVSTVPTLTPYEPAYATPYRTMMERFLDGRLSASDFETSYLRMFKDDQTDWPEPVYQALNEVFLDLDAYCPDPDIRDEFGIDEAELRVRVERSLAALRRAI
jgi:hypothetical protein